MTTLEFAPSTRFTVPPDRTATEPPEHRGLRRDEVRLLVARPSGISHRRFHELPDELAAGDLIVVNDSQTIAAELTGRTDRNRPVVLHVATPLDDGSWVVELRTAPDGAEPILDARPGDRFGFGDEVGVELLEAYPANYSPTGHGNRLWRAAVEAELPFADYLSWNGRPISYGYLSRHWPLSDYQTVFGRRPGSAEMPSAARPFSTELVTRLVSGGVGIAPITLHTGVSSQEAGEGPQPERFSVPASTARLVNQARAAGGRVIAVGTTVTRALESAANDKGIVTAAAGWTELVLGPARPVRVVSGLISGWHNPDASHLLLVEAVIGAELAQQAYDAAVAEHYLWHEFGDSCLLLPDQR